jgi:hypothetical protein
MSIFLPVERRGGDTIAYQRLTMEEPIVMKKIIALAVAAIAFQVAATFAGEPISSKQVVAPPPPPPEFF